MKLPIAVEIDEGEDIVYLSVGAPLKSEVVTTVRIDEDIAVDFAGLRIVGIEVMNASKRLTLEE
jgi:uncharacterized protein YuzE